MSDLSLVADALRARTDCNCLLATRLHIQGSFYRRPGARALLDARDVLGSISAGCLARASGESLPDQAGPIHQNLAPEPQRRSGG